MDNACATHALHNLCYCLYHYYGKRAIILLDGCDKPMKEAYLNGYWDEMSAFIRSLFNCTFKVNPYLERALMTGLTCTEKITIFSDLNMEIITATSNSYTDAFGFTEEEVFAALDAYGLGEQKKEVRKWYGGFACGNRTDIYNPWSVTNYLDKQEYKTYWADANAIELISNVIQRSDTGIKEAMEDLLQKNCIVAKIDEGFDYNELHRDRDAIWSLLLASGYLKVLHNELTESGWYRYELGVTNSEMRHALRHMIKNWFNDYFSNFVEALMLNDLDYMNPILG